MSERGMEGEKHAILLHTYSCNTRSERGTCALDYQEET